MGGMRIHPGGGQVPSLPTPPGRPAPAPPLAGGHRVLRAKDPASATEVKRAADRQKADVAKASAHVAAKLSTDTPSTASIRHPATRATVLGRLRALKQKLATMNPFLAPKAKVASLGSPLLSVGKARPLVVPQGATKSAATTMEPAESLTAILNTAPSSISKHANWPGVFQRAAAYLAATEQLRGPMVDRLMAIPGLRLADLVGSIKVYSSLDKETAAKMAFQRELANMEMNRLNISAETNEKALGCKHSYASGEGRDHVTVPGRQLSLAMETLMQRDDGAIKQVTVLSCSAPALDVQDQPEWGQYIRPDGRLDFNSYQRSLDTLKGHIIQCISDNHDRSNRLVLSGIGVNNFLKGVRNPDDQRAARDIVAKALAEAAHEARTTHGLAVGFTDLNETFCGMVNQYLGAEPLAVLGKIPGNWIEDGDLILNAWDPHSLVGNGMALDRSIDGYIGNHSLVHLQHALACAMHAEGIA